MVVPDWGEVVEGRKADVEQAVSSAVNALRGELLAIESHRRSNIISAENFECLAISKTAGSRVVVLRL